MASNRPRRPRPWGPLESPSRSAKQQGSKKTSRPRAHVARMRLGQAGRWRGRAGSTGRGGNGTKVLGGFSFSPSAPLELSHLLNLFTLLLHTIVTIRVLVFFSVVAARGRSAGRCRPPRVVCVVREDAGCVWEASASCALNAPAILYGELPWSKPTEGLTSKEHAGGLSLVASGRSCAPWSVL